MKLEFGSDVELSSPKILVACEFSQVVTKAFRDRGFEAYSCDLLPAEGNPDWHIQDDVLNHLNDGWDLMIAHPPCTYLANSGVRWLMEEPGRYQKMLDACKFFNALLDAPVPRIAIENPIQHKYARQYIRRPDEIIQPWWFGEDEAKATCLWLKNLPPLIATLVHSKREGRVFKQPPSPDRSKLRSRTYSGVAKAMAEQWGGLL